MSINIGAFLYKRALLSPDQEALVCDEKRWNYAELNRRANQLAHAMKRLGVGRGDRVAVLALNEPEYYDLLFGLGKIGAILVPVNYRLAAPEVQYILADSAAKVFVFGKEYAQLVDAIRSDVPAKTLVALSDPAPWARLYEELLKPEPTTEPEIQGGDHDTLSILYTSGTTGRPKGAMLTHNNYFNTSVSLYTSLGDTGNSFLVPLPLFHIGALAGIPMFVHFGKRVVLLRSFDAKKFLQLIPREKINGFGSVPQLLMFLKLLPEFKDSDWSTVKVILVYAAPVPVNLIKEYDAAGIEVRQLYGLTECTGPASVIDSKNAILKAGSCGLPIFHSEIKLVDDSGKEVGPEELGEVLIRADNVMKGYWNKPEETARALRNGWLYTGDLAKKDKDGFIYILDRKKDMIISGGENIYPAEIEDVIIGHPKVADVGVIGCPDPKWGEAVKAIVVPKKEERLTPEEIIEWCQQRIGKFKVPKYVVFAESLPRTPTGKILKKDLRQKYNQ